MGTGPGGSVDLTSALNGVYNIIFGYVQQAAPVLLAIFAVILGVTVVKAVFNKMTQ
jgi:hypothetical protein